MAYSKIKELRENHGLTQLQVAEKLNIPLSTYRSYETGVREPGVYILITLSELYGVTTDYLLDHKPKLTTLSFPEIKHIKKYRALDEHGKKMVDFVTDTEYERMCEQKNTDTHSDYTQSIAAGEGSQGFKKTKVVGKFADQVAEIEETAEDDPERPLSICRK